ncbi:MAG: hypothetical protein ABFC77_09575 [Thermoguttaceae bacterium]
MNTPRFRFRLSIRLFALVATLLAAYGCAVLIGRHFSGGTGVAAASLAAGACGVSAVLALLTSHWIAGVNVGAAAMLLPMMIRIAPPLLVALAVRLRGPGLVEAGFVYYLISFYLLALGVELPLSLPPVDPRAADAERLKE